MSEWNNYSLGGLAEITSSKRIFYSEYVDSGIPFYRSKEVINLFKKEPVQTELFITHERFNEIESKFGVPNENDILLTSVGSLGIPYLVKASDKFYFKDGNLTWFRNIDKSLLDPKYLYIWLSSSIGKQKLDEVTIGSTQAALTISGLKTIEIELPPLPEQKAIASALSSLDDKIDLLHRQNKTLEAMAETLFRQWFIEEAREDWEETTLEHHIVAIKGLSYKGSGLCDVGQGIPMFNLNSVLEGGGYKTTGLKYYKGDYKERHLVKADDIIVANTEQGHEHRLIGFPAVIPSYFNGENIFTHHIFKVSTLESTYLTNQFIYYLLRSSAVREQITGATNGSTVNQLAADGLQRPKFRLPPKNLVQSFTNQVISFWRKKDLNQQQIWSLENLRNTLLPKLMSGEMRVQYQTEEVA